jgi:hypothetical protein
MPSLGKLIEKMKNQSPGIKMEDAMKKSGPLIVLFAALTLFSCGTKYFTVTVENQSSKDVTYTYTGIEETLPVSGSRVYHVEIYTPPPGDISVPGAMSVEMESQDSGERYVFKDIDPSYFPLALHVTNNLSIPVELRAGKYIHDKLTYEYIDDGSGGTRLFIPANMDATAAIYTVHPNFTVFLYTPTITWEIKNDVMEVVIADQ